MHLGIIGAGLIGGSIARAARANHAADKITVIESSEENARKAYQLGLGDECGTEPMLLQDCDLIILATSSATFDKIGPAIAPFIKKGAIVSDVASVKGQAIEALAPHIPAHAHFIPAHPIAGTENSGLEAGMPGLFKEKYLIVTPLDDGHAAQIETVTKFWENLGAHTAFMSPDEHDAVFAIVSHLPHMGAFCAMNVAVEQAKTHSLPVLEYAATSFGDYTRVSGSDPKLWADIAMANSKSLVEGLDLYIEHLQNVRRAIVEKDDNWLVDYFSKGQRGHHMLQAYKAPNVQGF